MAKKVEYHNPDFEDDILVDVGGLAIPNGGSIELSEEDELSFVAKKQMKVDDYFSTDKMVKISGKTELSKAQLESHIGSEVNAEPPALDEVVAPDAGDDVEHADEETEA